MNEMKKFALRLGMVICAIGSISANPKETLRFNPDQFKVETLMMPDGTQVEYKAYENIYYVENVEDSTYPTLNIYVPANLADLPNVPILLHNYVAGYSASKAKDPSAEDATGRALQEGFVVCIPGSRGKNSTITRKGKTIVTGTVPNGLLDVKAATRYLRYNDDLIPGDSERIFTDGTSAGGAMSALQGTTGNSALYDSYLKKWVRLLSLTMSMPQFAIVRLPTSTMQIWNMSGCTVALTPVSEILMLSRLKYPTNWLPCVLTT